MKFHPCNHSNAFARQVHGSIFSILRPGKTQLASLNSRGAPHLEQRLANVGHQFTGHPTLSATRVDAFLVPPF
jgi:hypothetical protein